MNLFEQLIKQGRHISIMAHFSHYNELSSATLEAVRRLRSVGCNIRTQAPLMKHINDSGQTWARMWEIQVQHGMIPYYMFIARDILAKMMLEWSLRNTSTKCMDMTKKNYHSAN